MVGSMIYVPRNEFVIITPDLYVVFLADTGTESAVGL